MKKGRKAKGEAMETREITMAFSTLTDLQDEYITRRMRIEEMPSRGIKYYRRKGAAARDARVALLKRGYSEFAAKMIIRDAEDMVVLELSANIGD